MPISRSWPGSRLPSSRAGFCERMAGATAQEPKMDAAALLLRKEELAHLRAGQLRENATHPKTVAISYSIEHKWKSVI